MNGEPLDLGRRRDLRELLRTTFGIYRSSLATVLAITATIVVVVDLIEGIGLNQIVGHYQAKPTLSVFRIQLLVLLFVLTPLVNASVALMLLDLSKGNTPRALPTIQRGLDVFAPALIAVILYAAAVVSGALLLVLPGIYFLVTWYFATQAVAIEGRRAFGALARSGELVGRQWFRVLAILVVVTIIGSALPMLLLRAAIEPAAKALDAQAVVLVGNMIAQVFSLSFVSLVGGLLFFDLRAARAERPHA